MSAPRPLRTGGEALALAVGRYATYLTILMAKCIDGTW